MSVRISNWLADAGCSLRSDDISAAHEEQLCALAPFRATCFLKGAPTIASWLLPIGLGTPLPPCFPENEPNFSFRINKTMQKRTQTNPNEPRSREPEARSRNPEFGIERGGCKGSPGKEMA